MSDYNNIPELPDDPGVFAAKTRTIIDIYADEISEHANHAIYIYGLGSTEAQRYKFHCYEAARHLQNAGAILNKAMIARGVPNIPKKD